MGESKSTCRSCGKKVLFIKDEKGTTQVLDLVAPVFNLPALQEGEDPGDWMLCKRSRSSFVTHFATCPKASSHSKRKAKKRNDGG